MIASVSQPHGDVTVTVIASMGQMRQTVPTGQDVDRIDSSAMTALDASPNAGSVTEKLNVGMDLMRCPAHRRVRKIVVSSSSSFPSFNFIPNLFCYFLYLYYMLSHLPLSSFTCVIYGPD